MIFGNLEKVLENEQSINEAVQNNFNNNPNKANKPTRWSKILTSLSHYGMNYSDEVYKNMVAFPADKAIQPKEDVALQQVLMGTTMNNWKVKPEEEKSFAEKTLEQKRDILRKMAMQPELEDILDIMANESVVYDDDESYICTPFLDTGLIQDLNEKSAEEIRSAMDVAFYKIYLLLEWKKFAWDEYKRFLIDGVLAYEIVYDNIENPKSIIGIVDLDPVTLTQKIKDGTTYWIQFEGKLGFERVLLDSQVIYIKYEDSGVSTRQSYLERLIRPFNLYRIVEQAQVIWTVTQASFKTLFTIPIGSQARAKGMQTLANTMNRYKEDISFNVETGELKVNGKMNMPFNKEYWLPEGENGRPQIETLVDNGPMLNDSDQIRYFETKLWKMSKIPVNRFDKEAQSTWFGSDPTQALRDEIDFSRFVTRLRNTFSELMLKPLRIQLTLSVPDIKNDKRILDSVSLRWNSYNLFEEQMNIEVMTRRVEFIGTMKDSLSVTDAEGNEESFFSLKFLVMKYLKMSDADLELNEKYKMEEKLAKGNGDEEEEEEGGGGEEEDMGGGESEEGGGGESEEGGGGEEAEGGDIDDEMMGDVQPESSETTQI